MPRFFEVDVCATVEIDQPLARVVEDLRDIPRVVSAQPRLAGYEVVAPGRYFLRIGPFGVGSFSGTIKCEVDAIHGEDGVLHLVTRDGAGGNTDCRVMMAPRGTGSGTTVMDAHLWARPRREVPAAVPLDLVRRVAARTARAGLERGLQNAKRRLERSS